MKHPPHVGLRTVKTAIVVFISLALSCLRPEDSNPLYIAVAAILSIQPTMETSRKEGVNRLIGTAIGGFWGILIFVLNIYALAQLPLIARYFIVSLAVIPIIVNHLYINRPSSIGIALVVFLVIATSPVGEIAPLKYVGNRLLDTFLGFVVALAVNKIKLSDSQ